MASRMQRSCEVAGVLGCVGRRAGVTVSKGQRKKNSWRPSTTVPSRGTTKPSGTAGATKPAITTAGSNTAVTRPGSNGGSGHRWGSTGPNLLQRCANNVSGLCGSKPGSSAGSTKAPRERE
jgi:hypothetical protein